MFILKIENEIGDIFKLTQNENNFQITNIEGLNPPNAQIKHINVAGRDGALFNSSKLETRNIVITVKINGDVEKNRLLLYNYFRTKEWCKIFYKNGSRDVFIEGYVEILEVELFTNAQMAQISIICPDPYFKDLETIVDDISKVISKFSFPFSINIGNPIVISSLEPQKVTNVKNTGESETGLIIDTAFKGNVDKFEIRNIETGERFILNYSFIDDDNLSINCNKGSKAVTLLRNGIEYNLLPYISKGSTFFQLRTGDNDFSYLADDGVNDHLINISFKHYNIYRGV